MISKIQRLLGGFLCLIFNPGCSFLAIPSGKNYVSKRAKINRFVRIHNSRVKDFSYIGPHTRLIGANVGKYCSIGWCCDIGLPSHPTNLISTSPIFYEKNNGTGFSWVEEDFHMEDLEVIIGSDVWIGAHVKIMSGVSIGDGAIIGAGALVTKDVPPYAIVGGVPASIIRFRFSKDKCDELEGVRWWDLSEEELRENISQFIRADFSLDFVKETKRGSK